MNLSNRCGQWLGLVLVALAAWSNPVAAQANPSAAPGGIAVNQVGFLPRSTKIAVVPNVPSSEFFLVDANSGREVLRGPLSQPSEWDMAGQTVKLADFGAFDRPGHYRIRVQGLADSPAFRIAPGVYSELLDSTVKAYYFNRASAPLEERYAGAYARPAGHPDTLVYLHPKAYSKPQDSGRVLSAPKGWYDAGDFNKYVVNSGITLYTLLTAFTDHQALFAERTWQIPESQNKVPDLLDEIRWNLDWLLAMQDPRDGGVYHKLSTLRFAEAVMPHTQYASRFMLPKSTAAALNFAAVSARASQVFAPFDQAYAQQLAEQARAAWRWARANPKVLYLQPEGVNTGTYARVNEDLKDEWLWAASELFELTGDKGYARAIALPKRFRVPEWDSVETLALFTLVNSARASAKFKQQASVQLVALADEIVQQYWQSGYRVPMIEQDFRWGSNGVAMNKAMILIHAYRLNQREDYQPVARALLDYVLGRNPTGYSFVTGAGEHSPQHIHHRVSYTDGIPAPIPGFLAGGPHAGWQDNCDYPSRLPALSYLDHWCSYSTNEIAINWNAPLVYVLASLQTMFDDS